MTERTHLFPSRTQKLSSPVPMILGRRRLGKVGRCQIYIKALWLYAIRLFFGANDSIYSKRPILHTGIITVDLGCIQNYLMGIIFICFAHVSLLKSFIYIELESVAWINSLWSSLEVSFTLSMHKLAAWAKRSPYSWSLKKWLMVHQVRFRKQAAIVQICQLC